VSAWARNFQVFLISSFGLDAASFFLPLLERGKAGLDESCADISEVEQLFMFLEKHQETISDRNNSF